MEQSLSRGHVGICAILSNRFAYLGAHSTVRETWQICSKAFQDLSIAPSPSPLTSIAGNPAFSPGLRDSRCQDLKSTGLFQARHFIVNRRWVTRPLTMEDPRYAGLPFWQKQLAHFIGSVPSIDALPYSSSYGYSIPIQHSSLHHVTSQTACLYLRCWISDFPILPGGNET